MCPLMYLQHFMDFPMGLLSAIIDLSMDWLILVILRYDHDQFYAEDFSSLF
jgi:hypothetical protein